MIGISVCIPAYNEEKNIKEVINCILAQKLKDFILEEIIVISSGSTDSTNRRVLEASKLDDRIKVIIEENRYGKFDAVNKFSHIAKSKIIVLESADTILAHDYSLERLCRPLLNPKVGIVSGRPLPLKGSNRLVNFASSLMWELHHHVSLKNPKFGELIAFRNVIKKLTPTAADEEEVARLIKNKGYLLKYEPGAICYNKAPQNLTEFLSQRKRIFSAHLMLFFKKKYAASTLSGVSILSNLPKVIKKRNPLLLIAVIMLEAYARVLGFIDFCLKREHIKWNVAISTKELNLEGIKADVIFSEKNSSLYAPL